MTHDHNRYIGLCLPYAYGKLNLRTARFFEQHLKAGCAICNKELAEIYEAMSLLPLALPQKNAPSSLRNKVLAAAKSSSPAPQQERTRGERRPEQRLQQPAPVTMRQSAPSGSRPWFGYAIAFAAVLIVVALGWYTTTLIDRLDEQEQQIIALTNDVQAKDELLKVLQAPRIGMVFMNGTNNGPAGYGKIIWDPEKKVAIFQVANLPTVPTDKDYQLWVIKKGMPVSAGVFAVEDEQAQENYFKVLSLDVTDRSDFDAFAVTLEPKGGLTQPSGNVYLISERSAIQ